MSYSPSENQSRKVFQVSKSETYLEKRGKKSILILWYRRCSKFDTQTQRIQIICRKKLKIENLSKQMYSLDSSTISFIPLANAKWCMYLLKLIWISRRNHALTSKSFNFEFFHWMQSSNRNIVLIVMHSPWRAHRTILSSSPNKHSLFPFWLCVFFLFPSMDFLFVQCGSIFFHFSLLSFFLVALLHFGCCFSFSRSLGEFFNLCAFGSVSFVSVHLIWHSSIRHN